ncbi:uncharacterized protein [Parasteatoda tepidariorum]|uniref:uncharacterized protein n=1 Tax=Parasteatoda tepidariorum TaxID=114398 RepID=UPI0039BD2696
MIRIKPTVKYLFLIVGFLLIFLTEDAFCKPKGGGRGGGSRGGSSRRRSFIFGKSIKGIGRSSVGNYSSGNADSIEWIFIWGGLATVVLILFCYICIQIDCDSDIEKLSATEDSPLIH